MIRLVEVGPRDGLQNEATTVGVEQKVAFINALAAAGERDIEVGAFVHPKWVPQMAGSEDVIKALPTLDGVRWSALVPNLKGLERALACGIRRIAVFTAASETFNQKNINMSIQASLDGYRPVVHQALQAGLSVRGYVSTVFVCPYEGDVKKERVLEVTQALLDMGVDEVSLGDTIGAAAPNDIENTVGYLLETVPPQRLALHCHDTYGTALANVVAGLNLGIRTFDASAGGLGGCPYAPGASGNLATEDLVYLLTRMGFDTGIDLDRLAQASGVMEAALGRQLPSRQLQRLRQLSRSSCAGSP
ncbi:MAG TPA: hydroxymethylglutaryl-CoA lyase [Candidatus Xenobia bacterium]|jgi:hydroxymethylglutaryl-CoA lyase